MKLNKLVNTEFDCDIDHLVLDSRDRVKNGMFFCLKGLTVDGHQFAQQAVENGAVAVVHSDDIEPIEGVIYIRVVDVMTELHRITDRFYDSPSKNMYVYGITGTNGKSTTMLTVRNILKRFGVNAGYIGTISVEYNDHKFAPSLTTPDIVELQSYLHDMRSEGVEEVCLEVSSQGLALRRVESIDFDNASFTNLTHDHLDYHKTMENYFEAKKMLFDNLKPSGFMVINIDNEYGETLLKQDYSHVVTYGIENKNANYRAQNIVLYDDFTEFTLVHEGKSYDVVTNFVAIFNVYNMLNVIAILHQRGYEIEKIIPELKDIEHVDGRQTMISKGQPYRVIVDFGHAPDSMKNVYEFVRETQPQSARIITVFGAAGGRDTAKRPIMGRVASTYCDHVIITEHDNRDERVVDITEDIITGIDGDNYEFVPNRIDAIEKALKMAQPGDTVVLIGKGEEKFIYREHGTKEKWMGDEVCASRIIEKLYGGKENEIK
ncbi:UDP-N-acetylmuramoyl-L-alanyl-D-glutamate--2,6-diaminopimelate ligase [Erysipelothrix sp. strain 2 (EsS2-7-Brazil)]|uniref:UDP-N-acetylmuramoyl-L-alanyl-D-glutamate--2, 6-diaminopimelate ligase n=1 Tax=Erysipelothrix sp. strain 2 (EsS2-7-Brazil) TaxID=2500579 RepID=UPI00190934ED|nr:UDP-N-acetylmuramoyl-L-alanyl-D-glutamate--2,6-diaminopimelate ligase [Erysipelothrix sp. strain 2 (EsS2-7-Brazil)]MBK2404423.1 UDP-N-acetylmuramoyl-L-alanyl-D-glutamate--2,6-diaminopimelate ligase [Erysipelothrix sp. strain 2 (EsS2-7-Brazil)]